ncbi:MAG: GMC family oxidoreductase [Myxococcaceae bacterium]|nr:GMC family oxidoreductase [Myxococcaceae bacterium]
MSATQPGRIYTGDELTQDTTVACDVCIIGSGSGGSWLGHELGAQGLSVVMLEEGGYHTRRDFDMTEARAYPALYQDLGNRTTDDLAITLLQGRSVGGGTTVNWCSSFRTPKRILDLWRERYGVEGLDEKTLTPHWEAVEARLNIREWPLDRVNRNNHILWNGLGQLGYQRGLIKRNVHQCANLGYCGLGCPIDAKQSMLVTTLPDAVEKYGLQLYANASARYVEHSGRRARAVHADILNPVTDKPTGVKLTVNAKTVAVCGGAINSPALLLRSGIDGAGTVGKRTWLHPVAVMVALFDEPVDGYAGAPQSVYSHHFEERGVGKMGFFLEVPPIHPLLASSVTTPTGAAMQELMANFTRLNAVIALHTDGLLPEEEGGTVSLKRGAYSRIGLQYAFTPAFWEACKEACKEMAKVQFAAGARRVMSLHDKPVVLDDVSQLGKLDAAPYAPLKVKVVTAHQMGGCAMGKNAATSVVDARLKLHGFDNLFVVDGSVFPTGLGVNPQLSIFGLARWAATHVAQSVHG